MEATSKWLPGYLSKKNFGPSGICPNRSEYVYVLRRDPQLIHLVTKVYTFQVLLLLPLFWAAYFNQYNGSKNLVWSH